MKGNVIKRQEVNCPQDICTRGEFNRNDNSIKT